jgi:hypothetical protein
MKKTTLPIIISAAIGYTYLFYHQLTGINYLVFDVLFFVLLAVIQYERLNRATVLMTLIGLFASSIFVFVHNTGIAVFMHWLCFGLFVRLFYEPELSIYLALPEQGFITVVSIFNPENWKSNSLEGKSKNCIIYLLMLPIVGLFVFLYSAGNEQFGLLVSKVFDFEFNFSIIPFFLSGIILAFSVFAPHSTGALRAFDITCNNKLVRLEEPNTRSSLFGLLENELKGGLFLFFLLNLLTLSFHATDLYYFFVPVEHGIMINHSQQVHQGVNSLIVSIVLAIVIVLYFFRGELNFIAGNKGLKILAFVWLFQNILLAFSTAHRNYMYIDSHGLTNKRIGVYVWLILVAIGIIWTFVKIIGTKTTWYLLRTNSWTVYIVMLCYTAIPWDRVIVRYNLTHLEKEIDFEYLKSLGASASIEAYEMKESNNALKKDVHQFNWSLYEAEIEAARYKNNGWQSYNLECERITHVLNELKIK